LDACTKANKPVVLEQLAAVANTLARGEAPLELAPFLAGASLFALEKKDGGIRPIAIGEILRRLVGKALCKTVQDSATEYFWPHQVGVACSQGTECAVHVVNQWVARNASTANRVVLKLDFANAFNTVDRETALAELRTNFPQLARWAQWLYGHHSHLFFGDRLLASATGVQQGDPIGPLLFSCAIHPLVRRLARGFREAPANGGHGLTLFYLDDGILCGDVGVVAEALKAVQIEGRRLGLELKLSKCELILVSGEPSVDLNSLFPRDILYDHHGQDRVVRDGNFEFLGAPIGNDEFCASSTKQRVVEASKTISAICKHTDPQIGLRLLRSCSGFCKMVYSVRVIAPHAHMAELRRFDSLVRQAFSDLTGLHPTDAEWGQATRGFDSAGLGLRSTVDHGLGAYLASRANSWARCREIDEHFTWEIDSPNSAPASALTAINALLAPEQQLSAETLPTTRQKAISAKIDEAKFQRQFAASPIPQKASLNSERLPGASGFLSAVPSKVLGLAFNPPEFVAELQTRLWMSVYPHDRFCPCCDTVLDTKGAHARLCMAAGDVVACHNGVRNLTGRFAESAGHAPTLEQAQLLPPRPDDPTGANLRRPADVYLPSWIHGSPAALDFAVVSPLRQDIMIQAAERAGAAATAYETHKRNHLNTDVECTRQGVTFIPMVAESSGGWGPEGLKTLRQLAKTAAANSGRSDDVTMGQLLQRLCVVIRSAKARAILRRAGHSQDLAASAVESAAAALTASAD
jgi:hypothetical protein